MAQPDAAWLAEFASEHGRAPAVLFETRLSAVRAELLQQQQQQLEATTAQHQVQVAQNQQQQQELVAVHQQLEAKNQELTVCKKALADVRAVLDAVQPPAKRPKVDKAAELRDAESAYTKPTVTASRKIHGVVPRTYPPVSQQLFALAVQLGIHMCNIVLTLSFILHLCA
jgi:chromosome segregation ATPase